MCNEIKESVDTNNHIPSKFRPCTSDPIVDQ